MVETRHSLRIRERQSLLKVQVSVDIIEHTIIADSIAHESVLIDETINGTLEQVQALNEKAIALLYKEKYERFLLMRDHDID